MSRKYWVARNDDKTFLWFDREFVNFGQTSNLIIENSNNAVLIDTTMSRCQNFVSWNRSSTTLTLKRYPDEFLTQNLWLGYNTNKSRENINYLDPELVWIWIMLSLSLKCKSCKPWPWIVCCCNTIDNSWCKISVVSSFSADIVI